LDLLLEEFRDIAGASPGRIIGRWPEGNVVEMRLLTKLNEIIGSLLIFTRVDLETQVKRSNGRLVATTYLIPAARCEAIDFMSSSFARTIINAVSVITRAFLRYTPLITIASREASKTIRAAFIDAFGVSRTFTVIALG
jgi:hypothetical protein